MNPPPTIVAWSTPNDLDSGFVPTTSYTGPDIICHRVATSGGVEAPVKAGGKIQFQWTPWPMSHHGPVLDYMANCNGPCETVDKTTLKWFKIDHKGLLSGGSPGTWATDTLIANNNSWTVTVPPTLKTSNYVIRHEIIALHAAGATNETQSYPFCFNLAVTGTGAAAPSGIPRLTQVFWSTSTRLFRHISYPGQQSGLELSQLVRRCLRLLRRLA
jgi:hypothetical protein